MVILEGYSLVYYITIIQKYVTSIIQTTLKL